LSERPVAVPVPPVRDAAAPSCRTVALHPSVAGRYLDVVAPIAVALDRAMDDVVMANRVVSAALDPPRIRLDRWRAERHRFAYRLHAMAGEAGALVMTDVRDCYASMRPPVVRSCVGAAGVEPEAADRIEAFLETLPRIGIRGLPVGPAASAVLANSVLGAVDARLRRAGLPFLRWVDDVVVAVRGPDDASAALGAIDDALASIGLERHVGKTRVVLDLASVPSMGHLSPIR